MPLTPFIGLSALVHLAIIIGRKMFGVRGSLPEAKSRETSLLFRYLGMLIVVAISALVIVNAVVLVMASAEGAQSSFALYRKGISHIPGSNKVLGLAASAYQAQGEENNLYKSSSCDSVVRYDSADWTLVDYLKANGEDPSFENRSILAEKFGIENYHGDFEENQIILNSLLSNNGKFPGYPPGTCN